METYLSFLFSYFSVYQTVVDCRRSNENIKTYIKQLLALLLNKTYNIFFVFRKPSVFDKAVTSLDTRPTAKETDSESLIIRRKIYFLNSKGFYTQ